MNTWTTQTLRFSTAALLAAGPLAIGAPAVSAQTEYEPGTGYHQEEWYDPSDWFNGDDNSVSYEELYNDRMNDSYDYSQSGYDRSNNYDYNTDSYDANQRQRNNANQRSRSGANDGYILYWYEASERNGQNQQANRQGNQGQSQSANRSGQNRDRQMNQNRQQRGDMQSDRSMSDTRQGDRQQRDRRWEQNRSSNSGDIQRRNNQSSQANRGQRDRQQSAWSNQQREARAPQADLGTADNWGQRQIVEGRLTEMTDVNLQGVNDSHRLIKLERADGSAVVVDLGQTKNFADFELERDDYMLVFGETGKMNDKKVVFARHIAEVNTVPRNQRADRASNSSADASGNNTDARSSSSPDARDRSESMRSESSSSSQDSQAAASN